MKRVGMYASRVRRICTVAGVLTLGPVLGLTVGTVAGAQEAGNVCEGLESGKIDVAGDQTEVVVTAPEGFLIDRYCVKAGSENQADGGPEYVTVDPPAEQVTIFHATGKGVSHYSVSYVEIGEENNTPTPGGNNTPTPGGNNTPTPGGNNTPTPGGNNTPTPGGNNTPTPGGNNEVGGISVDAPAVGGVSVDATAAPTAGNAAVASLPATGTKEAAVTAAIATATLMAGIGAVLVARRRPVA